VRFRSIDQALRRAAGRSLRLLRWEARLTGVSQSAKVDFVIMSRRF
jgi:hypothetical protein